jgi:hypothetical protein
MPRGLMAERLTAIRMSSMLGPETLDFAQCRKTYWSGWIASGDANPLRSWWYWRDLR